MLDGTVQPMLQPELDLADAHLSRALDELARLADAPLQGVVSQKSNSSEPDDADADNQIPQPLPEPIPIEVPLPPTPVIIQPPTNAALMSSSGNGVATESGLLAELAMLSAGMSTSGHSKIDRVSEPSSSRNRLVDFSPLMVSSAVLVLFLSGMLTERFVRIFERGKKPDQATLKNGKKEITETELTGRISYKTREGESQPDRGARVLVFPQQRFGEVKLSVVGFRPADAASDQVVADAALKALGGSATTVDEQGRFHLPIEPGTYSVLVISHYQPRDDSAADPALDKLLSEYFDNFNELLGRVQHYYSPLKIKGGGDVWDHSF